MQMKDEACANDVRKYGKKRVREKSERLSDVDDDDGDTIKAKK